MSVWSYPPILIIHLKRFHVGNQGSRRKIDTFVEFPVEKPLPLKVRRFASRKSDAYSSVDSNKNHGRRKHHNDNEVNIDHEEEDVENVMYSLYSVCNHYGSLHGGHYTAYAKNFDDDNWYSYNDSAVNVINNPLNTVCTSSAYVLFFKMEGLNFSTSTDIATEFRSRSSSERTTETCTSSNSSSNSVNNLYKECILSDRAVVPGQASIDPSVLNMQVDPDVPTGVRSAQFTPTKNNKTNHGFFSGSFIARIAGLLGNSLPNFSPPHSQIKPSDKKDEVGDSNEINGGRLVLSTTSSGYDNIQ